MGPRQSVDIVQEVLSVQAALLRPDTSLDGVMGFICDRALVLSGADGATIELEEGDELVYRVASGEMERFTDFRLKAATSLSGRALRTGRCSRARTPRPTRVSIAPPAAPSAFAPWWWCPCATRRPWWGCSR